MIPIEYLAKPEYAMAVVLYVLVGITNLCVTVRFAIPLIRHGNLQYGIDLLVIHKIRMLFVSLAPIMSPGYNKTFPLFDDNPKAARIVLNSNNNDE
eukprot:jgi/Hompol1/7017/HPOL_000282-RA